jgi:hypothetical protein
MDKNGVKKNIKYYGQKINLVEKEIDNKSFSDIKLSIDKSTNNKIKNEINIIFELSIERSKLIGREGIEKRKHYRNYLQCHQKEILEKILSEMIDKNKYECEWNYLYKEKEYDKYYIREGELYSVGYIKNIKEEEIEIIKKNICDKLKISNEEEKIFNYEENNNNIDWYENKLKEGVYKYKKKIYKNYNNIKKNL